jgi:hypothetical protein
MGFLIADRKNVIAADHVGSSAVAGAWPLNAAPRGRGARLDLGDGYQSGQKRL